MHPLICKDDEGRVYFGHKWATAYYRVFLKGEFAGAHERRYFCPRCGGSAFYRRTKLIDFNQIRL